MGGGIADVVILSVLCGANDFCYQCLGSWETPTFGQELVIS